MYVTTDRLGHYVRGYSGHSDWCDQNWCLGMCYACATVVYVRWWLMLKNLDFRWYATGFPRVHQIWTPSPTTTNDATFQHSTVDSALNRCARAPHHYNGNWNRTMTMTNRFRSACIRCNAANRTYQRTKFSTRHSKRQTERRVESWEERRRKINRI